ncbi:hypothetical protein AKJ16_DCAP21478 [Drosera capensis]
MCWNWHLFCSLPEIVSSFDCPHACHSCDDVMSGRFVILHEHLTESSVGNSMLSHLCSSSPPGSLLSTFQSNAIEGKIDYYMSYKSLFRVKVLEDNRICIVAFNVVCRGLEANVVFVVAVAIPHSNSAAAATTPPPPHQVLSPIPLSDPFPLIHRFISPLIETLIESISLNLVRADSYSVLGFGNEESKLVGFGGFD